MMANALGKAEALSIFFIRIVRLPETVVPGDLMFYC